MEEVSTGKRAASHIAAAIFHEPTSLHDAVSDLRDAGFGSLAIAFSTDAKGNQEKDSRKRRERKKFLCGERHSLGWRTRHAFESDLHRQGAEVLAGKGSELLSRMGDQIVTPRGKSGMPSGAPGIRVDLDAMLRARGVPQFRIDLVNREIGPRGSLLLVEAGDRLNEAQEILEGNRGIDRTETAMEQPPEGAEEHEGLLEFQVLRETVL